MENKKKLLENARRIVVKVGTSTITYENGQLNLGRLEMLVRQLADLHNRGLEVLLVSSGAVGAGMGKLGLAERPSVLAEKQAAAAVGQGILMSIYERFFGDYGKTIAQLLLTRADIHDRGRFLNSRNTLLALLKRGVIPVINENDTVSVDEIQFGDNDQLAAMTASLVDADLLVLLTDKDGLYTSDPEKDSSAEIIPFVENIDAELMAIAGDKGSRLGSGGMVTKLEAGRIAMNSGIAMVIANGSGNGIIGQVLEGSAGTLFYSGDMHSNRHAKKKWLAYGARIRGVLCIDDGAVRALKDDGKSLLPVGITSVSGNFLKGDTVRIISADGIEIAAGKVNYDAEEVEKIRGHNCAGLEEILGYSCSDEVVHRDNLALKI